MRIKWLVCGICKYFTPSHGYCKQCGAQRVRWSANNIMYYNMRGIQMVSGIPTPMHKVIERIVARAEAKHQEQVKAEAIEREEQNRIKRYEKQNPFASIDLNF